MKVLSVFDGMSCGQIALMELGIPVEKYYSSEIDKSAIKQTQYNFPDTIQLGSITDVKAKDIEKIDLFIGGSPCQGFSFAGKQLNFDDPRSSLFFEYVRLWKEIKEINPNAKFLLENVNMKKEYLRVISEYLGVFPARINSNLVSAQNRDRWYWTNIKTKETGLFSELWTDIPQPEDRGVMLKDILQPENEIDEKYYLKDFDINREKKTHAGKIWKSGNKMGNMEFPNSINKKSKCLTSVQISGARETNHIIGVLNDHGNLRDSGDKSNCIDANYHKGMDNHAQRTQICVAMRGRNPDNPSDRKTGSPTEQRLEAKTDGKTNCLTSVAKDNLILQTDGYKLRRLTPTECARLQTIPEWYKWGDVSDTQKYRMLGNGWTVEVIKHIFSYL